MNFIFAVGFVVGTLMMGSDGIYFPWINFIGLVIFYISGFYTAERR